MEIGTMAGWETYSQNKKETEKRLLIKEQSQIEAEIKELDDKLPVFATAEEKAEYLQKSNPLHDRLEEIDKLLTTLTVGTDQSIADYTYTPTKITFSLGDINGRAVADGKNRVRIPEDIYNNTNCAQILPEGYEGDINDVRENISLVKTDSDDTVNIVDIQGIYQSVYDDDKDNMDNVFSHTHDVVIANAENKKAFELLREAKDPLTLAADDIQTAINSNLCARAKRHAVIITNKSGFAKLDIDIDGTALVTRNTDGEFVYKKKYIVREVPDEILPNTDEGKSPVIIGDMNIVRFFLLSETRLVKHEMYRNARLDRGVRKEIITLSTTSDEAYIHGVIA